MAKKFSFRLEPVLKLRTHKVNQAKEELNVVVHKRTEKEREISSQEEYLESLIAGKIKSTSVSELQAQVFHKNFVQEEIKKLEEEKKQLLEIEFFKRLNLTQAMKQEKVLEKLKEKKQDIYKEEITREEVQGLDEIARNGHSKQEHF